MEWRVSVVGCLSLFCGIAVRSCGSLEFSLRVSVLFIVFGASVSREPR